MKKICPGNMRKKLRINCDKLDCFKCSYIGMRRKRSRKSIKKAQKKIVRLLFVIKLRTPRIQNSAFIIYLNCEKIF